MMTTTANRFLASLRLVGVSVVLAAGIAGFASLDPGSAAQHVELDLAVVTTVDAG